MIDLIKKIDFSKYTALIAFVILFVALSFLSESFLTTGNLVIVFRQIAINGLIAGGMTFVILSGGIDLSVGSILGFTSMSTVILISHGLTIDFNLFGLDFLHIYVNTEPFPVVAALIVGIFLGGFVGAMNGFFIARMKLQPFIVTLASMTILRGLTLVISGNRPVSVTAGNDLFLNIGQGFLFGIPIPIYIFIFAFIIFWILLEKTQFGKKVYSIGGNEEVARLSGIKTIRTKIMIYAIIGICCAIAGIILSARLASSQPVIGVGFELDAIAAVVIGGTSLAGGRGRIFGTFIGVLIIGFLGNGMNLLGIQSDYQEIVKGGVILLAVLIDRFKKE